MYTVSFFGHRRMDSFSPTEEKLLSLLRRLSDREDHVEFLVGRDGDFDQLVASSVLRTKKGRSVQNSSLIWVMAYPKAEYLHDPDAYAHYYDEIEICEASEKAYPKAAISLRNHAMIDRSDLCVFYVERASGGAFQALQYAKKQGKTIVNLAESR